MTDRRGDATVLVAIAIALIAASACGASWSAAGWRDGITRAVLAVVVGWVALRPASVGSVVGIYTLGGLAAAVLRTFVIVPVADATLMPELLGPNPTVSEAMDVVRRHPDWALWRVAFDFAMLLPVAVLLGETRRISRLAPVQLLAGVWLAAVAALDGVLHAYSDHGTIALYVAIAAAVAMLALAWRNKRHAPVASIALVVGVLVASIALWAFVQRGGWCEPHHLDAECTFQT